MVKNWPIASGSAWLELEATDKLPAAYESSRVFNLGLPLDGYLMRHAYTVSRSATTTREIYIKSVDIDSIAAMERFEAIICSQKPN